VASCTTTEFVTRWYDPEFGDSRLERILVIGMLESDVMRREFEDEFSRLLSEANTAGIPSYSLMPEGIDVDEKSEIQEVVRRAKADSVLITTLTDIEEQERRVPATVEWTPTLGYPGYSGFYDYYGRTYRSTYAAIYQPAYTTVDSIVKLETRVFYVDTESLVWAADTESFNPGSSSKVIADLAKIVIKDLRASGLIR